MLGLASAAPCVWSDTTDQDSCEHQLLPQPARGGGVASGVEDVFPGRQQEQKSTNENQDSKKNE